MKFCPSCNNTLYYMVEDNLPITYCQVCGYKGKSTDVIVYKHSYQKNIYQSFMKTPRSEFVKDITYPRTIHYDCPNKDCITHKDPGKKEAMYLNEKNSMRQIFICVPCLSEWKL